MALAFEIKTTRAGVPIAWEPTTVPFQTDPSVQELAPDAALVVEQAMEGWSGQSGAPVLTVTPRATRSMPAPDGNNVIYFFPRGYPAAGTALAVTILTFDDTTGHILDADVAINGLYDFGVLPEGSTPPAGATPIANDSDGLIAIAGGDNSGTFDIAHVLVHETGHTLGLGDEMVAPSPVMFLYTEPGDATHRSPTSDDLKGIADLYADITSQRGCSSSVVAPRHPRPSTWGWAASGIGLALLVIRLRRRTSWRSHASGLAFAAAVGVVFAVPRFAATAAPHLGDAKAKVVAVRSVEAEGPWQTEVSLSVVECRVQACPKSSKTTVWGGHRGHLVQEVGEGRAPEVGDELEIKLPTASDGEARIITPRR